jgi:enoyl-[acyl-carrier protein] reductase I
MLSIDLRGKVAFIAGVGDDQGFGWAIAKQLAEAGATILVGTWPPMLRIFSQSFTAGKFDESRKLLDGRLFDIAKVYPLDATFDSPQDVPEDIRENKRYKEVSGYTISDVAQAIQKDYGKIDILIHAIGNAPEVQKPLLETSRRGYLAALSASSYSFVSLLSQLGPIMNEGGAAITLTYLASESVIPGYGGGMNSAKAALESDTRVLAYEAGRKHGLRVNAISAGPYGSRAAKAIGFIERMIGYSDRNSPLKRHIDADEVANTAAFLTSSLASGITGVVLYVDCGLHVMGIAEDSTSLHVKE